MRFQLLLSPAKSPVNFDYQGQLTGVIHKWLGRNEFHDELSLYSFSWLSNAKVLNNQLHFRSGSEWFISFWDNDFGVSLFEGMKKDPYTIGGMKIKEMKLIETPELKNYTNFIAASPILIRDFEGDNYRHYTYQDEMADHLMTATLSKKLKAAGIDSDNFTIRFDRTYTNPKTKLVNIHGINNRASICPVIIEGDEIVKQFAWNVGVGHSTGTGFGSLR